jgi:S-adenosylmethionine:tRNA ribosyltransferase-isomerase
MKLSDFDYTLNPSFIAQYPLVDRSQSKLLVLHRTANKVEHTKFCNIQNYLQEGDVLVLNNTKVLPARLLGKKPTGGQVEVLLLRQIDATTWESLLNPSIRVKKGATISFDISFSCMVVDDYTPGNGSVRMVRFNTQDNFSTLLEKYGRMPLPPYMKREVKPEDVETYQTVFAQELGAVAAPTAGLHFTQQLLDQISSRGVEIVFVTLHVGYGTFRPVQTEDVSHHTMHREYYSISQQAASAITHAKRQGRRIIACGTTSVRVLESSATSYGEVKAVAGDTDIFIYPPYTFKITDALITNFHLPKSTLLMLACAFAGPQQMLGAYEIAKQENYRFYSYGDAMFIV